MIFSLILVRFSWNFHQNVGFMSGVEIRQKAALEGQMGSRRGQEGWPTHLPFFIGLAEALSLPYGVEIRQKAALEGQRGSRRGQEGGPPLYPSILGYLEHCPYHTSQNLNKSFLLITDTCTCRSKTLIDEWQSMQTNQMPLFSQAFLSQ